MSNLFEKNDQVLSGITQLQEKERDLYALLENVDTSASEKENIINKINELSQMRMNMYTNLQNMYSSYESGVNNLNAISNTQKSTVDALENDLNRQKNKMNEINDLRYTKLRTVEINNYYAKRYNAYKGIMFIASIACIPILILTVLNNKSIIPSTIYAVVVSLIIAIAGYYITLQYVDISNRDNINWDSYSWYFNPNDAPANNGEDNGEDEEEDGGNDVCVGDECCNETEHYNEEYNICVPNNSRQKCPSDQYYDSSLQQCRPYSCPTGATYNSNFKRCICPDGEVYDSVNKKCLKCPSGSTSNYNSITGEQTCICKDSVYDKTKNICSVCPANSTYNSSSNTCDCGTSYVYNMSKNTCMKCPLGSTYSTGPPSTCVGCPSGQVYNQYKGICEEYPESVNYDSVSKTATCKDSNAYYDSFTNQCLYNF